MSQMSQILVEENERLREQVQFERDRANRRGEENERLREVCEGVLAAPELQARIDAALTELLATHGHLASEAIAESIKKAEKALKGE